MRKRVAVLLVLAGLMPVRVSGQIPEGMEGAFLPHPEAQAAIAQLYSPFCPGFMLEVCTAQASIELRDSIQALAYQGWTSAELVGWMLGNHGEQYRAVPVRSGWGMWAWILPPLGLLLGIGAVVVVLRRFVPEGATAAGDEAGMPEGRLVGISDEEEARLRSAIRELELSEDPSF